MRCAVCDHPLPDDARFCPSCGVPVSTSLETQERKLVTVLFADLVDSTGLAQRLDPERAREVLGHFFDAVTEELQNLRGQPEKFIGDAVMAVFGLPQVNEDDAVRAVRAGLAIRGRSRRLSEQLGIDPPLMVHVGVETGEAATGVAPSGQLLVTGSVVNAAARLQSAALPGEVLVGATTHALTNTAVAFGERRTVQAKGFPEPLAGYPVEGLSTRSVRRTIPFIGRANELTLLRDAHSRVTATGRPLLVTVMGEPGIGKSRLVDEFIAGIGHSVGDDTTVLVGRNQLASDSATFAPAAAIVRDAAGIEQDDLPEVALDRLRELVGRWHEHPALNDGDRTRTIERLALPLGLSDARRDESVFVQDVQAGFLSLAAGLAAERPTVLVFEDVHDLRSPMLDLIERLAGRGGTIETPVLIVATGRPALLEHRPTWGSSAANHVLLHLDPLGDEEAIGLARQAGGNGIPEAEARTVAIRAGGNPFFIIETTGMLLGRNDGPTGSGASLPATVQAVVAARLDSLPETQRELARRLSVYLYSFDAQEAALVSECSDDALHALEEAEIVVREREAPVTRWRFRHEMLRDVAYASLPKRLRLQLHVRIADSLMESGFVSWAANHLERAANASIDLDPADRTLPERAIEALTAAGERARKRMENRSAVDYLERALTMAGPREGWGVREARALAGIGEARYWLGDYPAAREALTHAQAIGARFEDDWTSAHALRFLGDIAINVDADVDRAEKLLDEALAAAERLGDSRTITRTLLFAGWVPWTRNRYDEAEPLWRRALQIARDDDDRWALVRALTSLSINRQDTDNDGARALIEEALEVAEEMDDGFSAAVATVQRGRLLEDVGRYDEALPDLDHGVAVFSDLGARWEMADALAERGIINRENGRLDEAERDLRQAIRISEELGERQLAGWTWKALARVAEKRGDRVQAEERWRRASQAAAESPR